jgi:signal transduction histidine kinase
LVNILLSYINGINNIEHPSLNVNEWDYRIESSYNRTSGGNIDNSTWTRLDEPLGRMSKDIINIIYYKTTLPNTKVADPHLLLQTNDQAFEIYLDQRLIYSFGNFDNFDYKHSPGAPVHLISLPEDYQGKELQIVMKSISPKRLGLIRAVELDSRGNHIMRVFKMNMSTLVLGCLNIVIGTVCMYIGVVRRLGRKALFSLGILFIVVGVWGISENALTQLFHFSPKFWFYVSAISFYLIPISVYKFIRDISKTDKRILTMLIQLHSLLFGASLMFDLSGILAFINTMIAQYILIGFSYTVCVAISIRSYLKGNKKTFIYTIGLVVFGVFGLYDVLGWYFGVIKWKLNLAPWGMLMFQIALIYALIVYLQDVEERFLNYRQRLKNNNSKLKEKERQIDQVLEYDKIKTEFFANVSHELRTPLNIIHSTAQLIKMFSSKGMIATKEASIEKYISIMDQNCYRLMKLVNNIIDMTKIESGFYKLEFKKINIVSLVENITMSTEEYVKDKDLRLLFDTEIEEKIIICDPDAIERILLNLISNAIKFSEKGAVINVRVKEEVRNILIEVEDTGIGIPHEELRNVFKRFVQVDKSFTRNHEGSGIGLALVKSLVEMHQGNIELISELNKGSKFIINLPKEVEWEINCDEVIKEVSREGKEEKVAIEFSDIYKN